MNSATNTAPVSNLVAANDVAPARRVRKAAKAAIVHVDVRSRDYVRAGRKYEGRSDVGHHVIVRPGVSVHVTGSSMRQPPYIKRTAEDGSVSYERTEMVHAYYSTTFRVGDTAVYDSFNLVYTGTIVAIGEKTVKIQHPHSKRTTVLDLAEFSSRNRFFDLDEIFNRNASWSD